jgi:hypothetical protein
VLRQGSGIRAQQPARAADAGNSAELVHESDELLTLQQWPLRQLRIADQGIENANAAIAAALEGWPAQDRAIWPALPASP